MCIAQINNCTKWENNFKMVLTKQGSISASNTGWFLSTALKYKSVASAKFSWQRNAHGSKQESKCSLSDSSHDNLCDKEWPSKL